MKFNILDYLDELTIISNNTSWIEAKCPVCEGKLKISKNTSKYGAYACYTDECHLKDNNLIRKKLYKPNSPFNQLSVFSSTSNLNKTSKLITKIIVKDKLIDSNITYKSFLTDALFIKPSSKKYISNNCIRITTYYKYDYFIMVRNDIIDKNNNTRSKFFYPLYKVNAENNTKYVKGLPDLIPSCPVYRKEYLQESIFIVEGEKCATILQYLGIAAITLANFIYTDRYLDRYISNIYSLGVKNVIYLMDNDKTGLNKAKSVCNYLSKHNIANRYLNLVDLDEFKHFKSIKGFDVYDLYTEKLILKSNINHFISKCLQN
jgi:5S rRNA maturation endonuclease (ribonuclease M5)